MVITSNLGKPEFDSGAGTEAHQQLTLATEPRDYLSAPAHRNNHVHLPCYRVRDLQSNRLSGTIPNSLGSGNSLTTLYVRSSHAEQTDTQQIGNGVGTGKGGYSTNINKGIDEVS